MVLLYHSIDRAVGDPFNVTVAPERFEQHLQLLSSAFNPMPIAELARGARRGSLPPGAVAVSFDDGYADNLAHAQPLLSSHGVPATVFIATGFVTEGRPFWWEELRAMLLGGNRLPNEVTVPVADVELRLPVATEAERGRTLAQLQQAFQKLPGEQMEERLAELRSALGLTERGRVARRPLDTAGLTRLASADAIEIGAHTRYHSNLSWMSSEVVEREIADSRADLAELVGRPPMTFSYPFGAHGRRVRRAAHRAGFELACGTTGAPVTWLTDRMELGRHWVRDIEAGELEAQLRGLLG